MKNTTKILVLLFAVSLLFACFSIYAFAADDSASENAASEQTYAEALAEHGKILEYYESVQYLNVDFEGVDNVEEAFSNASEEFSLSKGGAFTATLSDGALSVFSVNPTYLNIDQNTPGSFGINLRAKISASSSLTVFVNSKDTDDRAAGDYLSLVSVRDGMVTHAFNPDSLKYEESESAVAAGEYFELSFFLNKGEIADTVTIVITPDGGTAETYEYSFGNDTTDFISGKMNFASAYIAVTDVTLDYVEMYEGSYTRELNGEDNVSIIADAVMAMAEDCARYEALGADVTGIYEIVAKLVVTHGYSYATLDEELVSTLDVIVDGAIKSVSSYYASIVNNSVASIDTANPYNDRLDLVNYAIVYGEFLEAVNESDYADSIGFEFEEVASKIATLRSEMSALEEIKASTLAAYEASTRIPDIYLADYVQYEELYDIFVNNPICDTYYDDEVTLENITEANKLKTVVMHVYPKLKASAEAFVSSMAVLSDASLGFAERYEAYSVAKANKFTDSSYNVYLEGVTVEQLVESYELIAEEMTAISKEAEAFLAKVEEAQATMSYSVKNVALNAAKEYISTVEIGYPGVADALDAYNALRKDIEARTEATRRYLQAVLNVRLATTVSDKKYSISEAEAYAVLGNDISIDIYIEVGTDVDSDGMFTVTDANILLLNEKSAVVITDIRIENYVSLVNSIALTSTLAERRSAIMNAMNAKATLELSDRAIDDANAALNYAIEAYNADVAKANAAAENADNVTLSTLAKTVPVKRIAEIVAIIKKFYEE